MKKHQVAILAAVIFGIALLVYFQTSEPSESPPKVDPAKVKPSERTEAQKRAYSAQLNAEASRSLRFDQSAAKLRNNPTDRSELSEQALVLDDPEASDTAVMEAMYSLLTSIRTLYNQGEYPAGLNVEVTNSLLGVNRGKVGLIPMDSRRISENGELIDDYGTPFWIHSRTGKDLTIVSAGADRILLTDDDVAYPSD